MLNGMYSVSFAGPGGLSGSGVGAVKDGTINGGDAGYGYLGNFKVDGAKVSATLRIVQHQQGHTSVFGPLKDFNLTLTGATEGDRFNMTGGIPGQPNQTITIRGRKFAELAQ